MLQRLRELITDMLRQTDLVLLGLCSAATLYGILIISSAAHYMPGGSVRFVTVQSIALILGIIIYVMLSSVNIMGLLRHWQWVLAFNIGFILLLLTPLGITINENRAWLGPQNIGEMLGISFLANFPMTLQPAEIVKITFILLLAGQMSRLKDRRELKSFANVLQPTVHMLFMVGLLYLISNDAGSALVYVFIFAGMALAAGVARRWFLIGGTGAVGGLVLLWKLELIPSHIRRRVMAVMDHSYDVKGVGWQQSRSLLAIGSGGLTGQGLYQGTQVQSTSSAALPERYNDFIFASVGEELGMLGCLLVLILLMAIVLRCLFVARQAQTVTESLVCVGLASMLMFQTMANVGMCLFLVPVIGLTLPFFSYGGTSIMTLFMAMGVVSCIKNRAAPNWAR